MIAVHTWFWELLSVAPAPKIKYHRLDDLKTEFIFSQFWELDVQDQGVGRAGVFWGRSLSLPCTWPPSHCFHVFPLMYLCPSLLLQGHQSYWIRAHPSFLFHYLFIKALSPCTDSEVLGVGISTCELEWGWGWKWSESEVTQSCLTRCDPMDCSLPGSSVHGIFQARVLEWIVISFSSGSSRPRNGTQVSRIVDRSFTIWATREVAGVGGVGTQFSSEQEPLDRYEYGTTRKLLCRQFTGRSFYSWDSSSLTLGEAWGSAVLTNSRWCQCCQPPDNAGSSFGAV